jgi:hypothetical protein
VLLPIAQGRQLEILLVSYHKEERRNRIRFQEDGLPVALPEAAALDLFSEDNAVQEPMTARERLCHKPDAVPSSFFFHAV